MSLNKEISIRRGLYHIGVMELDLPKKKRLKKCSHLSLNLASHAYEAKPLVITLLGLLCLTELEYSFIFISFMLF